MTRRRLRLRKKTKFHEVQESSRKNVQESSRKNVRSTSRLSNSKDEKAKKTGDASDPHQRSPESVLQSESQHELCSDKLSPEILKKSRIRLEAEIHGDDTLKIADDVGARKIEKSSSPKCHELDFPMCDFKRNIESINDLPDLKDYPKCGAIKSIVGDPFNFAGSYTSNLSFSNNQLNNEADKTVSVKHDERFSTGIFDQSACRNISYSTTFRSNLESQPRDDVCIFMDYTPGEKREKRSLDEKSSQQEVHYKSETMDDCYLLDRTLSMNDDVTREMNSYLNGQSSTVVASYPTINETTSSIATYELRRKYISEPAYSAILYEIDKRSELPENVRSSPDEFELGGSSVCGFVGGQDESQDKKRKKIPNDNTAFETIGERLIANWHKFRKTFAYLRRMSRKICGEDTAERGESFLSRYKRFVDEQKFSYISASSTSAFRTPPRRSPKSRRSSADRDAATRFLSASFSRESDERSERKVKRSESRTPLRSTTPCSGSLQPLIKRCRTTLMFEDEDKEEMGKEGQLATPAKITDPFPEEKKESKLRLFPPDLSSCGETHRDCRISESLPFSNHLPAVSDDSRSSSPQKVNYHQDGTCKRRTPGNIATLQNTRNHVSRRKNIPHVIITWIITLCIWLKKKLSHLLNSSYSKLRQMIIPSSRQTSPTKKFDRLIRILRSENDKMLCIMSEKVTQLSTEFIQIQTSTEVALNALRAEVNVVRETSKMMADNNAALIQEIKKLRETLEEVQSKFSKLVSLSSSCPSSSSRSPPSPPPPPLSLPLPPLPPPFPLISKVHISESASISPSSLPPPPPPLPPFTPLFPSASLQSPMPTIQPTTPNSNKNNKSKIHMTKCSTPLFNRPSITVEDLLKVTLKKAPQNMKDNRRNVMPGPKGPIVSLEMLRNVKLKSAKRRLNDQVGRSPRSGRIIKSRTASSVSLSPILTGSEGNLERILRQVDLKRPRRLLSSSNSLRDRNFVKETQSQSLEMLTRS